MAATPTMHPRDTRRDCFPLYLWDDEAEHPIGVLDISRNGWSYIRYGPHYDATAALNLAVYNFANAANNLANIANAMNAANAPTLYHSSSSSLFCAGGSGLPDF